ncbi:hypothetical protein [Streptomyces sp. CB01881]|uniref:hypothetical protein n=1 Tax=Streptomyces sp. CB01881 TaxID=2078691 RepID=UPI000CDCADA0|nr:hypothetical protein [Streptomyces sp. CB01881]AUY49357.1 hypothetical protein C2142_10890 [Streptomyces sp. CB01881]TYC72744.1 hypothetical protein EH183_10885 [Streptomyces sp. CB01881]
MTSQFTIETADDSGNVLGQSFLTLDGSGEPAVVYLARKQNRNAVMVARRQNGQWTHEDTGGAGLDDGARISIGIDSHDVPHLAYTDGRTTHAVHAVRTGGTWSFEEVPTGGGIFFNGVSNVSMQLYRRLGTGLGADPGWFDMPAIAYRDAHPDDHLVVALKPNNGPWQFSTADPSPSATRTGVSLAYDSSDSLTIAYVVGVNDGTDPFPEPLKLASVKPTVVEGDPPWPPPEFTSTVIDHSVRGVESVSMARGTFFHMLVAYADRHEGYVKAWVKSFGELAPAIELVARGNGSKGPRRPAAAAGPGDNLFIAYLDNGQVMLAERASDHSWNSLPVTTGDGWPSLAFGSDGTAHLAYGTGNLMYARRTTAPA